MTLKKIITLKGLSLLSRVLPEWTAYRVINFISLPIRILRPPSEDLWITSSETFKFNGLQMYRWGAPSKPHILLLHGWNARGTQLGAIANKLKDDYQVLAFDAPGHGYSEGNKLNLRIYIETIKQIAKEYGPFEAMVAHSFAIGPAVISRYEGVACKKLVLIAGPNSYLRVVINSLNRFSLGKKCTEKILKIFEEIVGYKTPDLFVGKFGNQMPDVKCLVIHDQGDKEVPYSRALDMQTQWEQLELYTTVGLGHRRILRDSRVLHKISDFLHDKNLEEIGDPNWT